MLSSWSKRAGKLGVRVGVVVAVVGAGLFVPQELAWSAPETRMTAPLDASAEQVVSTPYPVTHVVVRWSGAADADVQLRDAHVDGQWQAWKPAKTDEDGGEQQESGFVIVDDANKLQVRVVRGDATDIRVIAIDAENGPRHLEAKEITPVVSAQDAMTPQPPIVTRSQWGADESIRVGTPEFAPIQRVDVHHTVTSNDDPNPAATVRAIQTYHVQGNGWNDIGYNFLIDAAGKVYEGRYARDYKGSAATGENADGNGVIGAHTLNHNPGTVGIALLGTFDTAAPTAAQQTSLEKMIAWEGDRHNLDVLSPSVVLGHRDLYQTDCPGKAAYALLPTWRAAANSIKSSYTIPGKTPGYWIAAADGKVLPYGNAVDYGSMEGKALNAPIISMARTPSAKGYWLLGADGGIFSYGDAQFFGSMGGKSLNKSVVALTPTPTGKGYWEVASDGGTFAFGDARFFGSMGGKPLNKPVVGISSTPTGRGYWEVASDGGVFAYGDAAFLGSAGSLTLNQPIVSMMTSAAGGYWLTAKDGGLFAYGGAGFYGSVPVLRLSSYAGTVNAAATATGKGYYVLASDGGLYAFGDARYLGAAGGSIKAAAISLMPES